MPPFKDLRTAVANATSQIGVKSAQRRQTNAYSNELQSLTREPHGLRNDPDNSRKSDDDESVVVGIKTTHTNSRSRWRYAQGWRFGAINCAIAVCIVFLINLVATIWGSAYTKESGVLFEGDCKRARKLNSGLHFLINLLSTILLSSSNYCMQCLSAPTRREIDKGHAAGTWLDIGVLSVRNLRHISGKRVVIWTLLLLSSLPLHLFYNSAVFTSLASHNYYALSVSQSFVDNEECFNCDKDNLHNVLKMVHARARDGSLERLENERCINDYAQMIQSRRRNVLLVASDDDFPPPHQNPATNNTMLYYWGQFQADEAAVKDDASDSYDWVCSGLDNPEERKCADIFDKVKNNPESWRVGRTDGSYVNGRRRYPTYPVQYCLSEEAEQLCKVQFILPIAILITVLNAIKTGLIFYTAFWIKEEPVVTIGDAVSSFMENEDRTTRGMCLLSLQDVKTKNRNSWLLPKQYIDKRYRWKDAISRTHCLTIFTLFVTALALVSTFLGMGIHALPGSHSLATLARLGFSSTDPRTAINWPIRSTLGNIFVANLAQPVLSLLYFSYNSLFTTMLLGREWSLYAHHRKPLRVSKPPQGTQRSTYFLQLPYRFAVPLILVSSVLHWLVSQSIFLLAVDFYDWDGGRPNTINGRNYKTCGYSPIAIVSVLVLGVVMVGVGCGSGFVPYRAGMSLVGSCSLAVSAACHGGGDKGREAAGEAVKWGFVGRSEEGIGHCAFSAEDVGFPRGGELYAGCEVENKDRHSR